MGDARIPDFSLTALIFSLLSYSYSCSFSFSSSYSFSCSCSCSCLTTGHHLEEQTAEIFRLRNHGQDRMIERLFEAAQAARGAAGIDERVGDHLFKNFTADMMRAGEGGE